MTLPLNFSNTAAETALNDPTDINATDTSIVVDDGSTYPTAWYKIQIDDEVILIASRSGNTMTVSTTPDGRGWDGTTAAAHTDNTPIKHIASAEEMIQIPRNSVIDYLYRRPITETAHSADDEFAGSGLGGWTAVDISGTQARTEDKHVMSSSATGGSQNNFGGILKSIGGLSAPVTIETHVIALGDTNAAIGNMGIGWTDGTIGTSNCIFSRFWDGAAAGGATIRVDSGTLNNLDAAVTNIMNVGHQSFRNGLFLRSIWKTTNTFKIQISIDGVTWTTSGSGDISKTMTPTQFGLLHHGFGSSEITLASFDYFRVYESDKSA